MVDESDKLPVPIYSISIINSISLISTMLLKQNQMPNVVQMCPENVNIRYV